MSYPFSQIKEKKGAFRRYLMSKYGSIAFRKNGNIKNKYITEVIHNPNVSEHIRKEAVLAKTYHRINVNKRSYEY